MAVFLSESLGCRQPHVLANRLEFSTAYFAEMPQRMFLGIQRDGLQLPDGKILFRKMPENFLYKVFRGLHDRIRRSEPNSAHQFIQPYHPAKVLQVARQGVYVKFARKLDKVGIQFFSQCHASRQELPLS
jgi:hypothetical protein